MSISESIWKQGRYDIYSRTWNVDHAKAVVCLVHGMGEHCARYDHVAGQMNRAGYAVLSYDQIGHGRTKSKRGHSPGLEFLLDSVEQLISKATNNYPGLPVFLYGHSMGGNVALNYILRRKPNLKGAIITSPWITLAIDPPKIQLMVGKLMQFIYPAFADHTKLDASGISRDENEVKKYVEDPLVHDFMSPGFFFPIHEGGHWLMEHASKLHIPCLLMHGTADQITDISSTRLFAGKAGQQAVFHAWDGGFHELHNDFDQQKVIAMMIDFMNTRLEAHD